MIAAHGASITVTNQAIRIIPSDLAASLHGVQADISIAITDITSVGLVPGDAWDNSVLTITTTKGETSLSFAPNTLSEAERIAQSIEAAQRGEAPATDATSTTVSGIPGFDFVAFDVETANGEWGSICQIGLVRFIDGIATERASWLCTPPPGLDTFDPYNVAIHGITADAVADAPSFASRLDQLEEFVGKLPIVAHNAQFDATALREAAVASNKPAPTIMFACTLAQSRAAKLHVENHKLPTLAEAFGVELLQHHDAAADAAACGEIMVFLAQQAGHSGSVMEFVHATGFTLGVIESNRVVPVLRDRSGAGRALQESRVQQLTEQPEKVDVSPAPEVSGAGTDQPSRRGPAPWQSVATPDTIPDPNPDADSSNPLFGQNVTLTGEFEPFDKGALWSGIAHLGGQVGKNVTKKTTILVTGEWATMTSKEKRARELIDKGQAIQIWPADKLLSVLGLDEEPPF
ncbi:exonuclease domain-containing protein [Corynebacterium breve]|uniref:Exonuclease domain-containing protein n=1 Tax=Corynebacterium breve TaxID=3049799 RepID=A0ABY8VB94_9CORY|nr:exonuclease domain-containing protein [Corynebacterium breve]WIM66941.1 exonuclease domain-containing protein [Corynebacterium breve]